MPNISDYDDQSSWMSACVPERMDEGEAQDQAVAVCLNIWRGKSARGVNNDMRPLRQKVEADDPELAPYGEVDYADPGLQSDGKARYPIDTEGHIRAAWNYIAHADNQKPYTRDQVRIIKKRIVAAWRKKIDEDGPPGLEEDEHLGTKTLDLTANQLVPAKRGNGRGNGRRKQAPAVDEGESRNEFIGRCLSETDGDMEACVTAWEERSGSATAVRGRDRRRVNKQTPNEGESREDFMSRCLSEEGGDMESCAAAWDAASGGENEEASFRGGRRKQDDYDGYDMPDPREGETESEFADRCTAHLEDEQDASEADADRLCALRWDNRSARPQRRRRNKQAPAVEEGEDRETFMGRCLEAVGGEEDAMEACSLAWDNRTESRRMRRKTHAEIVHGMTFILSDETPDRMGDVISANGWDLTNFKKNPIALFNHRSDFPIGRWHNLRTEKGTLRGELVLAPEGTSERHDEIRRLIDAGILRAVSVGFRPIRSEPRKEASKHVGEFFTKQELVETSLVSVPANPNALSVARSLDISDATMSLVFGERARQFGLVRRNGNSGEHAASEPQPQALQEHTGMATQLTKRITETQERIVSLRDRLTDHLASVDDSNVSDAEFETTREFNRQLEAENRQLAILTESERLMAGSLALSTDGGGNGAGGGNGSGRGVVVRQSAPLTQPVAKPYISATRSPQIPGKRDDRLDLIVKAGVINALAHLRKLSIEQARQQIVNAGYPRYGDDVTRVFAEYLARAEAAPAMTSVSGWAAELAQMTYADYMDLLYAKAVFPQLASHGLSLSFGRAGRISIPMRTRAKSIAGSFVGEGMAIPVRQASFRSEILTPKKMAVITTWTREMDEASIPAIEGLLRNAIQEDTAGVLDACLLDDEPADAIRPAGLLDGVPLITASATPGFAGLVEDLKALTGALMTATLGNIRDMVFLMNPQQVLGASLTAMPGVSAFPFMDQLSGGKLLGHSVIESAAVPIGTIIALDAADFVVVGGESPRFEISDQATLHMEDTDVKALVDETGAVAQPIRSLWQTDSLGLRLILPVNWTMRRDGMVAAIENVLW